jgi:REP element-mobilizing transposase RayT
MGLSPSGTRALRRGRVSIPNQTYVITTVTNQRCPVFRDLYLGRILVRALRQTDRAGLTFTLAYVVMPDHLHWLIELRGASISAAVRRAKGLSAFHINSAGGHAEHLWQPGFHDHGLRADEHIVQAARYIIANPIRAGLVKCVGDYPLWDCIWL